MAINQLSTANTFQEWLSTTSLLVSVANNLTDNTNGGFLANSSIFVEGVGASLNVRTLANINTLRANTANIANIGLNSGSITGNGTITMKDANVWGNIVSVNTTGNLYVGGDTFAYGNHDVSNILRANTANISNVSLISGSIVGNGSITMKDANVWGNVTSTNTTGNLYVGGDTFLYGNLVVSGNVTLDAIGFDDLAVQGSANITNYLSVGLNANVGSNIYVTGNATVGQNATVGNISMTGALVGPTTITGAANNAIYSTISAAIDSSIAFSIALG